MGVKRGIKRLQVYVCNTPGVTVAATVHLHCLYSVFVVFYSIPWFKL
jgi:hypothetical protein